MQQLKVLHIIDSLALGGAERVAVNMSNALADEGIETHLCVTRNDGLLRDFVSDKVALFFLNKSGTFDFGALMRLAKYVKHNHINVIHAHSSSIFLAVIIKSICRIKIVWHDHYGNNLSQRSRKSLKSIVRSVDYVYSVNQELKEWSISMLNVNSSDIEYLPNFPVLNFLDNRFQKSLPGDKKYKIVNVANLRPQKDHVNLIKAIQIIKECDLYIVGNDVKDDYSLLVHEYISYNGIDNVHILGGRTDIVSILQHCDIGVLSSASEGLPVSLLEYGLAGLPVVCTRVGECATVLGNGEFGILVEPQDPEKLAESIQLLIDNPSLRADYGAKFHKHVSQHYSEKAIIKTVIAKYCELLSSK